LKREGKLDYKLSSLFSSRAICHQLKARPVLGHAEGPFFYSIASFVLYIAFLIK
jgi:hypothetical protein